MRIGLFLFLVLSISCKKDRPSPGGSTEKLVIIFMDGARYTETFGEPGLPHIPVMHSLIGQATYFTSYYNDGTTNTCNGHTAVSTGLYQNINNGGTELPDYPSYLQVWIKEKKKNTDKAWVITSKDKLEVLRNCKYNSWKDQYMPLVDCGNAGIFTGYRNDTVTLQHIIKKMDDFHPNLLLINFKEPDGAGHSNNWDNYLRSISDVDSYVGKIWDKIQSDPYYKDNTTLIVTNDHGRHSPNIADGFVGHGDGCDGCRHIMLWAVGKGIPKGQIVTQRYDMLDLNMTISAMLGISNPLGGGEIIKELFQK